MALREHTRSRSTIAIIFWLFCTISIIHYPVLAAENSTITCGVILPLSGELGVLGTDILHGIELAADEINVRGGVDGYHIELRVVDDQGNPQISQSLFYDMHSDGVPVVIGSCTTLLTLPMAEETKKSSGTLLISPQANGEALYGISPWFFQVNAPVFYLAKFVSEWLSYTTDRVAVVYIDDEYGRSLLSYIRKELDNSSVSIISTEPVTDENPDHSTLALRILDAAPDTIVIIMYDEREISLIRSLADAGYRGQIIITESVLMDSYERSEADVISKFSLFTISAYSNLVPGDHTTRFISSYKKRFDTDPTKSVAGYGYDSLMLIAEAICRGTENGTITAQSIKDNLEDVRYFGVSGPKVFDSHHAVSTAMDRWVFKDGNFTLMSTSLPS
ncbi:ABC transporter substrate-binding protein [uncultured Methanospirillum sp.]|uniref:ABC transporter substrate-binding protein n=1 Tax=uncultured Methanospirillum sp. TaxID=262503 RepID=UPI0029C8D086|nr:ABC transporter substrate-binding protein [uncultured Methanospirillum sp.]